MTIPRQVDVAAATVITTDPLCPPAVPVIVAVPTATAVTVPDDETVATLVSLDDQAGLTVNEYETLLMKHDLVDVLRDPLRFMDLVRGSYRLRTDPCLRKAPH